jgi:Domain of unknown function (DUF427)
MSTITEAIRRLLAGDHSDSSGPARAAWSGAVLAESERTEDVNHEHLEPSPRRSICFSKGQAGYYDAVVDAERDRAAAWYAMAHPDEDRLVPACVQHAVLDPGENALLRRLLPVDGSGC